MAPQDVAPLLARAPAGQDFMAGDGDVAARMRAYPWSASKLGHPATWPHALRTVIGLLLSSKFPMFLAWGPELTFFYNDAYSEILGAKHPAALGAAFRNIWSEVWSDVEPLIASAMAGHSIFQEDLPLVLNRSGFEEQAWFTFSYSPVRSETGQIAGMFCVVAERTSHVLGERNQRFRLALEERLRGLGNPHEIMRAVGEMLGRFLGVDRAGYAEIDPTGEYFTVERDWFTAQVPSLVGRHRLDDYGPPMIRHLRAGGIVATDDMLTDPRTAGTDIAAAYRARNTRATMIVPLVKEGQFVAALFVHQAAPRHWIASEQALMHDVAERTWATLLRARAEAALRRQAERVAQAAAREQALFRNSPDGLYVVAVSEDLEGTYFTYAAVNPAAEQQMALGREDLLGRRPEHCLPPAIAEAVLDNYRTCLSTAATVVAAATLPRSDGARREVEITVTPIKNSIDGKIVSLAEVVRDVTDRNRMEAELRQTQKMKAIGLLAAGVGHDFNNILQSISGGLEVVLDSLEPHSTAHEFAQLALASASRGSHLTHHLLSYARKQVLQPKPLDLVPYLTRIQMLLTRTIGTQINVTVTVDPATPPVQVDPGQLETALINLAVNASHAMPGGGTLSLSVRAESDAERHWVVIAVTDTGCGMNEATLAQACEPFFSTKGLEGTGLGLSMVQGFVAQSGGQLRLASTLNVGTTVELRLPAAVAAGSVATAQRSKIALKGSGHILLVDDTVAVLRTTTVLLDSAGFQVRQAGSGEEALALLVAGARFDALVTDYAMSGMTGVTLIGEARTHQPRLPAVIITGFAEITESEALPKGVAVLRKPFGRNQLVKILLDLLGAQAE